MHMTSLLKSSINGSLGSSSEAVAEGARRATGETASEAAARRDPEVVAIAKRRQFSGSEKRRLLAEAERCPFHPLQGRRPETAGTTHRSLDQPTEKGVNTGLNQTARSLIS
jgi:hypothetical protein